MASRTIRQTLEKHGLEIEHFDRILDFGCGVGRIMRHWSSLQGPIFHGTDYNPTLVAWCRGNLKFAEFQVNSLSQRLSYEPETFDFIYAFSVFTHLSESLQFHWLDELSRVLKPGGHLYFTANGDYLLPHLSAKEKEKFLSGQLVVREADQSGSNTCATFHPATYVREKMARNFFVVDFISGKAKGEQDIYLFKKPAGGFKNLSTPDLVA
ncbi:MAG: class I SAM-dependent methyltransferase [Pyrinomonadaceae bacterium]